MVAYMLKIACWVAVVGMSVLSHTLAIDAISSAAVNIGVLTFTLWIFFDGIIMATDLKAAEAELINLQAQLRYHQIQTQTHIQLSNATVIHMKESYEIMVEVRNRLISLNNKLKHGDKAYTTGSLGSESCSTFSLSSRDVYSERVYAKRDRSISSI